MEMMAAIKALELLKGNGNNVIVCSDSQYLVKGASEWMSGWIRRRWKTSEGGEVQNKDLWEKINALSKVHRIHWVWVRGHNGHVHNERADVLARSAALGMFDGNMENVKL
jgi:ribonuclease HI